MCKLTIHKNNYNVLYTFDPMWCGHRIFEVSLSVVPTWEEKESGNLTLRVLKLGGWMPQPDTKSAQKGKCPKGGATGENLNFITANGGLW